MDVLHTSLVCLYATITDPIHQGVDICQIVLQRSKGGCAIRPYDTTYHRVWLLAVAGSYYSGA